MPIDQVIQHRFSPYTDNGGYLFSLSLENLYKRTSLAIAGEDFVVVAGDTRQSEGYSINTRYAPKVYHL